MIISEVWSAYSHWHSENVTTKKKNKKDIKSYMEKRIGQHHMAGANKLQGWTGYRCKDIHDDNNSMEFEVDNNDSEGLDQKYTKINTNGMVDGLVD